MNKHNQTETELSIQRAHQGEKSKGKKEINEAN